MDGNNNNGNMPDLNVLKGSLAVIFGIVLIVLSFKVVLCVLSLIAGLGLIYAGLVLLNMQQAVSFIDSVVNQFKRLFTR